MKKTLGFRATGRKIIGADDTFELREVQSPYGEASDLDSGNTFLWEQPPPRLIGQFLHKNWSIKSEIRAFLDIFSWFFNMLLWPDPRGTKKFFQRKEAKINGLVAIKALSNKMARASYFIMRDQVEYDPSKLFG